MIQVPGCSHDVRSYLGFPKFKPMYLWPIRCGDLVGFFSWYLGRTMSDSGNSCLAVCGSCFVFLFHIFLIGPSSDQLIIVFSPLISLPPYSIYQHLRLSFGLHVLPLHKVSPSSLATFRASRDSLSASAFSSFASPAIFLQKLNAPCSFISSFSCFTTFNSFAMCSSSAVLVFWGWCGTAKSASSSYQLPILVSIAVFLLSTQHPPYEFLGSVH